MRRSRWLIAGALVLASTSACQRRWRVDRTADGTSVRRGVATWIEPPGWDGPPRHLRPGTAELDVERLGEAYGSDALKEDGRRIVFERVFDGELPTDVGGAGSIVEMRSILGSIFVYREWFGGSDRLAETISKCVRAVVGSASALSGCAMRITERLAARAPAGDVPGTLDLSLACPHEPFATDGTWDPTTRRVTWPRSRIPALRERSLVRSASWAIPENVEQDARFGRPDALAGIALHRYVVWRAGLSSDDGTRWDAAVSKLAPGRSLRSSIEAIRLRDGDDDPALGGRKILLDALGGGSAESPKK